MSQQLVEISMSLQRRAEALIVCLFDFHLSLFTEVDAPNGLVLSYMFLFRVLVSFHFSLLVLE